MSDAFGVGRSFRVSSLSPQPADDPLSVPPSDATGVDISRPGIDEDALPRVGSADLRRCHARPLRMEPEGGQVSENSSKSSKKPSCSGVLVHSLNSGFQSTVSFRREEPFDILNHHQTGS
jgi:hypothetical protein